MDVNNAFLQEIWMKKFVDGEHQVVYKLQKFLYGFKQASRQKNFQLTNTFLGHDYRNDYSLFTKKEGDQVVVLLVYVEL